MIAQLFDPKYLRAGADISDDGLYRYNLWREWEKTIRFFHRGPFVPAWGTFDHPDLPRSVALQTHGVMTTWQCLGRTKHGHPRHPLYVHGDTPLEGFNQITNERKT